MPVSSSSHFGFPSAGLTGRPQGPQPGSSAFDTLFPTELLGHRLRPSSRSGGRAEAAGTVCQPSAPSSALSGLSVSSSEAAGCLWRRCLQGPFILTPWISQHVSGLEPDLLFLLLQVPGSPQRVLSHKRLRLRFASSLGVGLTSKNEFEENRRRSRHATAPSAHWPPHEVLANHPGGHKVAASPQGSQPGGVTPSRHRPELGHPACGHSVFGGHCSVWSSDSCS